MTANNCTAGAIRMVDIARLYRESASAGDLVMAAICCVAMEWGDRLEMVDLTAAERRQVASMTRSDAIARCNAAIAKARSAKLD